MNQSRNTRKRLFFALCPDDATRARLAASAHQWARHPVPADNLHITLQLLGACDAEQQACYSEAAAGIRSDAFELHLDYLSGWPRKRIQWLGSSNPPAALTGLQFVGLAANTEAQRVLKRLCDSGERYFETTVRKAPESLTPLKQ